MALSWLNSLTIVGVAQRLQREIPGGVILDQYSNVSRTRSTSVRHLMGLLQVNNPLAHELTTGPEIIEALVNTPSTPEHPSSGKVDVFVAGAGTGGTITGIAKAIKKTHNKDCQVVGVDPVRAFPLVLTTFLTIPILQKGSILAGPLETECPVTYTVEGIGYDFVPEVLHFDDIDHWMKTEDAESFAAVSTLMRREGLLVGGSSGSALSGALRWLQSPEGQEIAQTEGKNVVVLLADGYVIPRLVDDSNT